MESKMLSNQKRVLLTLPNGKIISYEMMEKMFFEYRYILICPLYILVKNS